MGQQRGGMGNDPMNTTSLNLTQRQRELSYFVLDRHAPSRSDLREAILVSSMSREQRADMCHLIGLEFAANGIAPNDEPTDYGLELESLLDEINRPNIHGSPK
jgi:hypothetical protein